MYTVRELRTKLKEALDLAEMGETVEIRRGGSIFLITTISEHDLNDIKRAEVLDKLVATPPVIAPKEEPIGPQPCPDCYKTNIRCKHWVFNDLTRVWKNWITGEERDAAL